MANLKRSKQRECIKAFLATRTDHPTADTIYMNIRQEFPNISLGTVYRNLALLSDLGEIMKITTDGGADRFDGNATIILSVPNAIGLWTWICRVSTASWRRPSSAVRARSRIM